MAGRIKISFHWRVFLTLLTLCWILVGIFMGFQYYREKEFRSDLLNNALQMHNARIIDDMRTGGNISDIVHRIDPPVNQLRVTVIDSDGNVRFDSNDSTPFPASNHNSRPEIIEARTTGSGHTVERHSVSDNISYFYSASMADDGSIVRSAAPYTHTLQDFLRADSTLLWIMLGVTLIMSIIGYMATRKISLSITRLNRFAEKAEKGGRIFDDEAFPNDELGSIASHIVRLYIQRDQQHNEVMRQEQEKIRMKKMLTNNINHELKTPVASILVCLDLLRDHPELSDSRKAEFNDRIYANALRLDALLKDVATITRMDEGAAQLHRSDIDVTRIVNDIVAEQQLHTYMAFHVVMPPHLIIHANQQLVESVFRNLIDNAIKYSGGTTVTITADADGNFSLSDNGHGIPDNHMPHIFERFYRIDKGRSRAAGGTGLGLAIVRNAIAIHGGHIRAYNSNGLRFDFRITS